MGDSIKWVTENWATIIEVYLAVIGLASVIVKLTPTLRDDSILLGIVKFMGKYLALNKTVLDANRPKG
jgi:hypothetical protein